MDQRPRGGRSFDAVISLKPSSVRVEPAQLDAHAPAGGLIVMVRPDPAQAAKALADDLKAELAIGGVATEAALDRLSNRLLAATDLDALAAAMRRAEAVREGTRAAAATRISSALNTRLAIHPLTIRRAATELLTAEDALREAQARVAHRHVVLSQVRAGLAGAVTAAAGAIALLRSPVIGGLVALGGVVLGGGGAAWSTRHRRRLERLAPLDPLRQNVAIAHRRWVQVAGADADPAKVDAIIHRYEPQHHVVAALLTENPAVRAADRVAIERRAAWVTAWRAATGDHAPLPDRLPEVLRRPETELWLSDASEAPAPNTLVVVSPYADLSDQEARELHRRLLGLPEGHRVIVVLPPDPEAPEGVHLRDDGWARALAPSGDDS